MNEKVAQIKRTVVFGAGQGGAMAVKLLGRGYQVVVFTDNNQAKWGSFVDEIPVISPEEALKLQPDCIWIALLKKEATQEIAAQLEQYGFSGEINTLVSLRGKYDVRLATMRLIADEIKARGIPGAVAELGVYQGTFAAELNRLFPERLIYLFDTFEGFAQQDIDHERAGCYSRAKVRDFSQTGIQQVINVLPFSERAVICKGYFPATIQNCPETTFCLVSLDADLYEPTWNGLCFFYPRLNQGGMILIHDYNSSQFKGVGAAVRKYCKEHNLFPVPLCDVHGTAVLIKQ